MKKTRKLMALVAFITVSLICSFSVTAANYLGDVNNDGDVTVSDAVAVQKYLVKKGTIEPDRSDAADMNSDGKVNVFDLILLKRTVLGEKEKVEITEPTTEVTTEVTTQPTTEATTEVITTVTTEEATDPTETTTITEITTEATTTEVTTEATTTEVTTEATTTEATTTEVTTEAITTEVTTEVTTVTTSGVTTKAVAGTDVNRAALVASFNLGSSNDNYWNQTAFNNAAEGIMVPEITEDGTYTVRLAVSNVESIRALGVRLFAASGNSVINAYTYPDLDFSLDSVIIDGADAVLTDGMTLANANKQMYEFNESDGGATLYLTDWSGTNSILPQNTAISEYIEITFTITGLNK